MSTNNQKTFEELVWTCAWCNEDKRARLKKGQRYTHGICNFHKVKVLTSFYSNKGLRLRT